MSTAFVTVSWKCRIPTSDDTHQDLGKVKDIYKVRQKNHIWIWRYIICRQNAKTDRFLFQGRYLCSDSNFTSFYRKWTQDWDMGLKNLILHSNVSILGDAKANIPWKYISFVHEPILAIFYFGLGIISRWSNLAPF